MRVFRLLFIVLVGVVIVLVIMLIHAWFQLQDLDSRRQQTRDRTHSALAISALDQGLSPFPDPIQLE